jgi:hypothetical protein
MTLAPSFKTNALKLWEINMSSESRKFGVVSAVAGGMMMALGVATPASAASVSSLFFPGALNQLSDNSAEFLVNKVGAAPKVIDIGDELWGIFTISSFENLSTPSPVRDAGGASGNNELTGIFGFSVLTKSCALPGLNCSFTFGPSADFALHVAGLANGPGVVIPGIVAAMFEDSVINYTRTTTIANGMAISSDGVYRAALGFGGDGDEAVFSTANSDDVSLLGATAPPGNAGTTNMQLSILEEFFGVDFGQTGATLPIADGLIDINGSGNLLGIANVQTGFDFFDNFDFVVNVLPEPGTVGLLGLGLAGLGFFTRRRFPR